MNAHQILAVTIRLFAIWLFLYAASNIAGSYIEGEHRYHVQSSLQPLLWVLGAVTIFCGALWAFPLFVAKRILPSAATDPEMSPSIESWFSLGCGLIGVWLLVKAVPALASYALTNYMGKKIYPNSFSTDPDWLLAINFNLFQLAVGIWLFFGAKGLKKLFLWARRA